jgi:DNA helicase-2/ATP-dependent DNA helicase PcrA
MRLNLDSLNNEQKEAVVYLEGPMLILAGAGSGKTRVLTYKAAHLMVNVGIDPDRILLTTFTNKAAQEMQARLQQLTGYNIPFAGTFHSLCARMLRIHGHHIGINADYVIYDTSDQEMLLKQVLKELNLDIKEYKPRSLMYAIEEAKHELINPADYVSFAKGKYQQNVASVYRRYQQKLTLAQALDFNDLLLRMIDLLREATQVRDLYQEKFLFVLVDEYQDTNKAQYTLTKLFAKKHQKLCVVGDASQAIYSWRGANYKNLVMLQEDYKDLKVFKLEQNYRSTPQILQAASEVVAKNTLHPILHLWTDRKEGEKITIYQAEDEYDEIKLIVKELIQNENEVNYSDYAVLYRTNAQSRVVEELFIRNSIPYQLVGGVKFYERKEIKDVLAYIRYAFNPQDTVSLERIGKLGKRRMRLFLDFIEKMPRDSKTQVILDQILEVTGYLAKYKKDDLEDAARIENVNELRSVAESFPKLADFLGNIALVEKEAQPTIESDSGVVTLMTLHASKGLEFKRVHMVGLEEGLFPHSRALLSKEELEEERRLCYVGMTRAEEKLVMSYAKSRLYFGSRSQNMVSRFIQELPKEVVEFATSEGKRQINRKTKTAKESALDDKLLEQFLRDEIDIEEFLSS